MVTIKAAGNIDNVHSLFPYFRVTSSPAARHIAWHHNVSWFVNIIELILRSKANIKQYFTSLLLFHYSYGTFNVLCTVARDNHNHTFAKLGQFVTKENITPKINSPSLEDAKAGEAPPPVLQ